MAERKHPSDIAMERLAAEDEKVRGHAVCARITAQEALRRVMDSLRSAEVAFDKGNVNEALGCLLDQDKNVKVVITLARVAQRFQQDV